MSEAKAKRMSECFVRPRIEVDVSKRIHHLNPFDLRFLTGDNAQLGYLFRKPSSFSPSSYIERLRYSLSHVLVHFYPLAGQLVTAPNEADRSCYVYVDCSKGPGARLISAFAKGVTMIDVLNPNSDVPKVVQSFFDLGEVTINYDGHKRPLLSVQVTELEDGVFLGFCYNHSVFDGISTFHFQRVWSDIFMTGILSSSIPLPLVKQPDFLDGLIFRFPYLDLNELIRRSAADREGDLSRRFFQFSPESLKKLKSMANSEAETCYDGVKTYKEISTFQALIAFVWKCITRVRNLPSNEQTICEQPVNLRPRFNPSLTDDYFGNYAVKAKGYAKVDDLLRNNLGWAAALLQQVVAAQDDRTARALVLRTLNEGPELILRTNTLRSNNVSVAGSPKFNVNESQFGLGRLVAFRGGYVNKSDGKVNAYLGSQGDGSVDLDICLAPETMATLSLDQEFTSFASQHNGHLNFISRI